MFHLLNLFAQFLERRINSSLTSPINNLYKIKVTYQFGLFNYRRF